MASNRVRLLLALALAGVIAPCVAKKDQLDTSANSNANPIRKVVTMLQNMQSKVMEEGQKEKDLYKKFMCYCKTSANTLTAEIEAGKNRIESLTSALKEATEKKAQTEQDLKDHMQSRDEAKEAMATATSIREKESADFAKFKFEHETNIAALAKAIAALEKGVMGAFLQTSAANTLRKFVMEKAVLPDGSRQEMLEFLSGSNAQGYVPQSGEIIGILKQLKDTMSQNLADATAEEVGRIADYGSLMESKKKEVGVLQKQIEEELARIGTLGVEIAGMGHDLEDTQDALALDTKFLFELNGGCDTKSKEWEEISATRAEELVALAETIRVLNDDDALELFKKTLPSVSASFVQMKVISSGAGAQALSAIRALARKTSALPARPELDFIEMALNGKQQGFEKVIALIDELVANLKKEQGDDDHKKEYCEGTFDSSDDKKKALENSIEDSETAIAEMEGAIAMLKEEIASLMDGIKALDKSVAEATGLRRAENDAYTELMMNDANAKEVLLWAKNRLYKFYSPKMYKPAPKRELEAGERVTLNMGGTLAPTPSPGGIADTGIGAVFVQISAHAQGKNAPPPTPETFGPYTQKGESKGVIAMIDLLIGDLAKEMAESETTEKESQREYEETMHAAASKRVEDSKSITDKNSAKAQFEEALEVELDKKTGANKALAATLEFIQSLHGECDWLLKYHDVRKAARTSEFEALAQAKAILSGADYSLVQTRRIGFLAAHN